MKGNYLIADAGLMENGLYMMLGCPVIRYEASLINDTNAADTMFDNTMALAHYAFLLNFCMSRLRFDRAV